MAGEREKIACGTVFSDGVLKVMKDHVFGWVVLLRDNSTTEEEAYTVDEVSDEIFEIVATHSESEAFPEEFREYLREFDKRTHKWRTRRLH